VKRDAQKHAVQTWMSWSLYVCRIINSAL